jgi:hypothetical protein
MEAPRQVESEFSADASEHGSQKHCKTVRRAKVSAGINTAICYLHTPPISRATLLELFDNRASFAAITAWRFGWRNPPLWAARLLATKMQKRISEMQAAPIPIRGAGPGERGAKTLAVWRERQAAEREAKRKAAELAALHQTPCSKGD